MMRDWARILLVMMTVAGVVSCRRGGGVSGGEVVPRAVEVSEDGRMELRLMSFNVRYEEPRETDWRGWGNRIDRVVGVITRLNPDLLGAQEVLYGQAADLRASLTRYGFEGVAREDGKKAGEFAPLFYRKDRFERLDGGTFWLSDTPERVGSATWGNQYPRVATWLKLVDRVSGRRVLVMNTHWDHRNQASRERSAALIAMRLDALREEGQEVVLLGDFNATEGNPAVDYLGGKEVRLSGLGVKRWGEGLVDTYQRIHPEVRNRRTLHFWQGHRDGWAKVDHVLVSRGAVVKDAGIWMAESREKQPSDHFPVWAVVEWK